MRRAVAAFTLIEVLIAGGILFMCLFAILGLLSTTLSNARGLQRLPVDPTGMLDSGDFGELYPDYRWISETNEVGTNGLFEVDFGVYRRSGGRALQSHMCILFYRPDSPRRPGGPG
jgi:hypothetical protein